jgi:hypothetical protein
MFKFICVAVLLTSFTSASAFARYPDVPASLALRTGDDGYGVVVNTNGGTFDGVALNRAVREDTTTARLVRRGGRRTVLSR